MVVTTVTVTVRGSDTPIVIADNETANYGVRAYAALKAHKAVEFKDSDGLLNVIPYHAVFAWNVAKESREIVKPADDFCKTEANPDCEHTELGTLLYCGDQEGALIKINGAEDVCAPGVKDCDMSIWENSITGIDDDYNNLYLKAVVDGEVRSGENVAERDTSFGDILLSYQYDYESGESQIYADFNGGPKKHYAIYTTYPGGATKHTINFYNPGFNDGTGECEYTLLETLQVEAGEAVSCSTTPTRPGCDFVGWETSKHEDTCGAYDAPPADLIPSDELPAASADANYYAAYTYRQE